MYFSARPSKILNCYIALISWLCRDHDFSNLFSFSAESRSQAEKNHKKPTSLSPVFR